MSNTIGMILVGIGVLFDCFGCIGLLRLPDVYNRLQAATKCVTMGTWGIMIGVCVLSGFSPLTPKAILAIIIIFFTSGTASHALARAAYKSGVKLWKNSVCDKYKEHEKL